MQKATFREFAGSVMEDQLDVAAAQLEYLLGLPPAQATTAVGFFKEAVRALPRTVALRTAIESGTDEELGEILVKYFGLDSAQCTTAVTTLRANHPRG